MKYLLFVFLLIFGTILVIALLGLIVSLLKNGMNP